MTTPSGRGSIEEDHPLHFGGVGYTETVWGLRHLLKQVLIPWVLVMKSSRLVPGSFPEGQAHPIDIESFEIGRTGFLMSPYGRCKIVLASI